MSLKLSCTMIVRDEAATLRACLESIRPHVDELVIVDTGSTDATPSIAAEFADKLEVWTGCNDAEGRIVDFSAARNRVLEMATGDALCWFDGDDLVRGGANLRKLVSEAHSATAGQPFAWLAAYEYERDPTGRVVTLQWRERIVYPRAGWEWRGPVHEGLLGKAGTVATYMQTDALVVQHELGQKPRLRDRNLRILEAYVRKHGESDPRMLHYYGAELMLNMRFGEAKHWLKRHNLLAPWSDERALSLMQLARVEFAMGDFGEAVRWALEATTTKSWPEPHWMIGMCYCELAQRGVDVEHNYKRAAHFLQRGFELDKAGGGESLLMKDPTVRYDAYSYYAPVLERMGRVDEAITAGEAALVGKPELADLAKGIAGMRRDKLQQSIIAADQRGDVPHSHAVGMVKLLRGEVTVEKVKTRLTQAPVLADLPDGKLRIAFFLGHQLEPWTPETLEAGGMGGSETMAWEMSKRLAKLGHHVTVYGHVEYQGEHKFEGVRWLDAGAFPDSSCDVLIVSRQAAAVTLPHSAKVRVLWVHDVHCGEAFTPPVAAKFDFVWCLSNWHKDFFCKVYPWLAPGKVEVTRNGIDIERFANKNITRNPHRAIYSSSPDRGLVAAIEAWPLVRAAIPDAELHIYYGFDNWEKALALCVTVDHPQCGREALNQLKLAIAKTKGIVLHGRVNQRELVEAMLGAGVWFYPTWFSETSCITAMEAQAAGLWCVCPPLAALEETVSHKFWGDPAKEVIKSMQAKAFARDAIEGGTDRFSLDTLATDWEKRLKSAVQSVVPAFHEAAQ